MKYVSDSWEGLKLQVYTELALALEAHDALTAEEIWQALSPAGQTYVEQLDPNAEKALASFVGQLGCQHVAYRSDYSPYTWRQGPNGERLMLRYLEHCVELAE